MATLNTLRVLALEDDISSSAMLDVFLSRTVNKHWLLRDGHDVIAFIRENKPDIILLDIQMPYRSGFEVFQDIRQYPEFNHIRIAAVSVMEVDIAVRKCKELGFDGFISKPLSIRKLPNFLERLSQGESVWENGSQQPDSTLNT